MGGGGGVSPLLGRYGYFLVLHTSPICPDAE